MEATNRDREKDQNDEKKIPMQKKELTIGCETNLERIHLRRGTGKIISTFLRFG
jgi:hypothetical protein